MCIRDRVDIQYFTVAAVRSAEAGPDQGVQTPYHPPIKPVTDYAHHLSPAESAVVSRLFPDQNYARWGTREAAGWRPLLTVNPDLWTIFRWDFSAHKKKTVVGRGLLELTTHSVFTFKEAIYDFAMMRTVEILDGEPNWEKAAVTWDTLLAGKNEDDVINGQMVIDVYPAPGNGEQSFITLSEPVLQRLLDGATRGLVLRHLGSLSASFYGTEPGEQGPILHLNLR